MNLNKEGWSGTVDLKNMDFVQMEHDVLRFWDENKCFEKMVKKNEGKKIFRFLDGPVTANNPMGVHHAWGRTLKDLFIRYKSMSGYTSHYRSGFDGQGLWVEVEVEKELGFKSKRDIENYGLSEFTDRCMERVSKYSKIITEQSKRLGQWMDWENSYYTNTDQNIEGIWNFLKVCHGNGWLKKASRPMAWCPRCGTSLSEHEMTGSHKSIEHVSVFAKLPVKGKDFEILVWTTTPWTLSANLAVAVNPKVEYFVVKCASHEKPLVLCKNAIEYLESEREVIAKLKGEELVGLEYETFFPEFPVQKSKKHKILAWDDVSPEDGSGIVHIAPGCGKEDYELCKPLGIEAVCPVDENGVFYDGYDFLSSKKASEVADLVFEKLKEAGKLFKTMPITHSYSVCWRCKTEVLFRLVEEWFIETEKVRPLLIAANKTIKWEPEYIGKRMEDWLQNMGDWNISRKRFYGLPLPIYECEKCGKVTVVGSKAELASFGGEKVRDIPHLHRPWIDDVSISCPECGESVKRILEVGDVWLDAGIVPFSTLWYFEDREKWSKHFPIEWITEMNEQVRLWFYSMLFMSVTLVGKAPYEHVLAYASVVSEDGSKFSKTGNMIRFDEAAEKLGADTIRYLYAGAGITNDVRFGFNLGEEVRRKLLGFWNIYLFFETYASLEGPDLLNRAASKPDRTDEWLKARVTFFVERARACYEVYGSQEVISEFEQGIDDISNWYVRINRKRFWQGETHAFLALFEAIRRLTIAMAPIIPFMSEFIWQNLVRKLRPNELLSVHLNEFEKKQDLTGPQLEILMETDVIRHVITLALKARNEKQIKIRQPLSKLYVIIPKDLKKLIKNAQKIIMDEINVKEVELLESEEGLLVKRLELDFKKAGSVLKGDLARFKKALDEATEEELEVAIDTISRGKKLKLSGFEAFVTADLFVVKSESKDGVHLVQERDVSVAIDTNLSEELIREGIYRELLRNCQVLRKEADFRVEQRICLGISSDDELLDSVLTEYKEKLMTETLATGFEKQLAEKHIEKSVTINGGVVLIQMQGI
ncbi:isoleucine--tRNA ligase [Clostridia bacterium]|nr:isoleucine--tRNA ligase [Clostridia bacterium]